MTSPILIVDYGSGNTRSMVNALRQVVGETRPVVLTRDPEQIAKAERVVLPGVGAFAECRRKLDASGVLESLTEVVQSGIPFMGVCVGMQVLADEGREFETAPGLGWIPGITRKLELPVEGSGPHKLPNVGWSPILPRSHPLFAEIGADDYFYFVHSYTLACRDPGHVAATALYGETFAAAVVRENVFGCQFHPEKSAQAGLKLLEAFCRWKP